MTLANLSAGLVASFLIERLHLRFLSQVLLLQQPGTPSANNSSFASVTELEIVENEHEFELHRMMKAKHAIVETDLGPADPGPVLLPEPTNTEHMIR